MRRQSWLYLLAAIFGFPLLWMLLTSLKTGSEIAEPLLLIPSDPQWQNYAAGAEGLHLADSLANTVVIAVLSTIGQVIASSLVAYGFARFRFPGRDGLFWLMLATMMLPPQVTMIPVFAIMRALGLVDTLSALIIPAWFGSPFFIYMFRQFFTRIPESLFEAARMDGAGPLRIWWQHLLPMSWPVVAIVASYSFLGAWNDFNGPLIYLNSPEKATLSQSLAGFTSRFGNTQANHLMAASVLTMIPCVIVFALAQRHLQAGDLGGSLKE